MSTELEMLIAQSTETITRLKDDLRLEERLRERLVALNNEQKPKREGLAMPIKSIPSGSNGGHRPAGTLISGSLKSHVIAIFQEHQRPMRAKEIAKYVGDRGYVSKSKGGLPIAVASLLAHNQDTTFRKIKSGLYEFLDNDTKEGEMRP